MSLLSHFSHAQEWDPDFWSKVSSVQHLDLVNGDRLILGTTAIKPEGDYDLSLTLVDNRGDIRWRRQLGGEGFELPASLQPTADGDFLVLASTNSFGEGDYDIWLLKIDSEGQVLWQSTFGGRYKEQGELIRVMEDGSILIKGLKESCKRPNDPESCFDQVWILKCDAMGKELWNKTTVMIRF